MPASGRRIGWVPTAFSLALPFWTLLLQLQFGSYIQPISWFFFYPTVFISAWAGGLVPGLAATGLSTAMIWYFFLPPEYSFDLGEKTHFASLIVFLGMGTAFSIVQETLTRAHARQASFVEQRRRELMLR